MSIAGGVIGLDFGTDTSVISQAKRGGIDTVMNEASQRKTHTMVGFQGGERFIGAAAFPLSKSNYKNTVRNFKRLLGRSFNDPEVQNEISSLPNKDKFVALENGMVGVKVNYNDEEKVFSMEQITSMILNKLRSTVNKKDLPSDVVVSVPGWWNERQRKALLNSCSIAGFKALRILNDHTAAALSYGIYKSARNVFDTEKQQVVMFVDVGYSNTSVAIVAFIQGKLQVLSAAFDPNLGGRDFDKAIFEKFATEFKEKHKLDLKTNPKSVLKLLQSCEKCKQTLTPEGVNLAKLNVEFLMNEIDFRSELNLEDFEAMSQDLLKRLEIPLAKALEEASLTPADIEFVEIIGGGTRPKLVKKAIATYMQLDLTKLNYGLSTTLNADEAVARGCALNSAMLSPVFRVKEFNVCDVVTVPIMLTWDTVETLPAEDGEDTEMTSKSNSVVIIQNKQSIPCSKRVTFRRRNDFDISAKYELGNESAADKCLPSDFKLDFAKFNVKVDNEKKEGEPEKEAVIRVDFSIDINGLFKLTEATALHEKAPLPEPKKEEKKKKNDKDEEKEKEKAKEDKTDAKMEDDAEDKKEEATEDKNDKKEGEKKVEEKPKKKIRYRKVSLKVKSDFIYGLSKEQLKTYVEEEKKYSAADHEIELTAAAKNALEAFVYSFRDKIIGELKEFLTESERTEFGSSLEKEESWLYDEGFDEKKEEYVTRYDKLKSFGDRFETRQQESQQRPKAIANLKQIISNFLDVIDSKEEKFDHINEEERQKVRDKIKETTDWLDLQSSGQDKLAKHEDPVLTSSMIKDQQETLQRVALPVVTKKRPPPPKVEAKKEEKMDVEGEKTEETPDANDAESKPVEETSTEDKANPVEGMEVD